MGNCHVLSPFVCDSSTARSPRWRPTLLLNDEPEATCQDCPERAELGLLYPTDWVDVILKLSRPVDYFGTRTEERRFTSGVNRPSSMVISTELQGPASRTRRRKGVIFYQQILGNCSPTCMSTTRVPPMPVRATTTPGCCATTWPMMTAS